MRPTLRILLLLIVAIALRGVSGSAFAVPMALASVAAEQSVSADCTEHATHENALAQADHQPGDKACQITCDLAVSPGLPASPPVANALTPVVLNPTRIILAVSEALPPDHPPPIR